MDSTEILNAIRILGNTNNFFLGLYRILSNGSIESEKYLNRLESRNFKNIAEIIKYYDE